MKKSNFYQETNPYSVFSSKIFEKSGDNKIHTENVRKLVKTVKEILTKCKKHEKITEQRGIILKKIGKSLSSGADSEKSFNQLLDLISIESSISSFEFTNESFGNIL